MCLEGRPSFVYHRMCAEGHTQIFFFGGGEGQSDIFEKIVEKEVKVSKLTFWNFFL